MSVNPTYPIGHRSSTAKKPRPPDSSWWAPDHAGDLPLSREEFDRRAQHEFQTRMAISLQPKKEVWL